MDCFMAIFFYMLYTLSEVYSPLFLSKDDLRNVSHDTFQALVTNEFHTPHICESDVTLPLCRTVTPVLFKT